ncbi:MAG: hypothetical protein AAGJ79_11155 [Verrucomicrobiota bacterium]
MEIATRLESGVTVGGGMDGITFRTQMLTQEEKEGAVKYLRVNNGFLFYTPSQRTLVGGERSVTLDP